MKITDVTTESYAWPRTRPIRNGKYTYTTAGLTLTRVETEEGLTGIGLGGVNRNPARRGGDPERRRQHLRRRHQVPPYRRPGRRARPGDRPPRLPGHPHS